MALPLIPAAGAALMKALGAAKAIGGAAASAGGRMAGSKMIKTALAKGFGNEAGKITAGSLATRLAPDIAFGGLAAIQTPGDLGDKLIAGGTQAIGGGLGGGLVTGLTGGRLGMLGELAGGYGGDMLGYSVGENLLRAKDKLSGGAGESPFEKMSREEQQRFADSIRNETLQGLGLGIGYLPGAQDQYLADLGMG